MGSVGLRSTCARTVIPSCVVTARWRAVRRGRLAPFSARGTHARTHTHTHTHTHTTGMCVCVCACVCVYKYMYIYTYI